MFSDCLALAFMALVFISALECICWKEEIAILQQQKRQKGIMHKGIMTLTFEGDDVCIKSVKNSYRQS